MSALLLVLAAATSTATTTETFTPENSARTTAYALLGFAYNPDAVVLFAGIERRYTYDLGPGVLSRQLYHQVGAEVLISGLFRGALFGEVSPLRILKVRFQYDLWFWPGFSLGKGHGLIFPDKNTSFHPDELERRSGEEISGIGHRFALMPTLQLKVWRIAVQSQLELAAWYVPGERAFWREPLHDTLIARGVTDATLKSFTLLLLEVWGDGGDRRIMAGGLFEVVKSLRADITRHRLGGAIVATPFDSVVWFQRPALFVLGGTNIKDRNREDELWLQIGLRLEYDLATE